MKFASLFAGIGGFDLGFEKAGMECVTQVEINKQARKILKKHWPDVTRFEDVQEVKGSDLGPIQLLCGGFPCQDISLAGRRKGLAGARSGLFFEFARLISESNPEWCVIENVPGLLSSNRGRDMGTVLRELGELGYWWSYRVLDSQHFGLAQRRKRVFIVGSARDRRAPVEVLFEPSGVRRTFEEGREAGTEVAGTLGGGSGIRGWPNDFDRMTFLAGAITANGFVGGADDNNAQAGHLIPTTVGALTSTGLAKGGQRDDNAQAGHYVPFDQTQVTNGDNRSNPQPGDPAPTLAATNKVGVVGFNHIQDPIVEDELSQPLGYKSGGMGVHDGVLVRRLSPTECERIQGFPDGWTKPMADSVRYRLLGNAVSAPVAEWIGKRIYDWQENHAP